MRTAALCFNVVLLAVNCLAVYTEGLPAEAFYRIFTFVALLVPVLTLAVLLTSRRAEAPRGPRDERPKRPLTHGVAIRANLVLLAFTCWAAVAQYPYAEGNSIIPFVVLMIVTPIVTIAALVTPKKATTPVATSPLG